jgi:hypothetical protein
MRFDAVEVNKEGLVAKARCCALHQPGGGRFVVFVVCFVIVHGTD